MNYRRTLRSYQFLVLTCLIGPAVSYWQESVAGTLSLVSVGPGGGQADKQSGVSYVTPDGRWVMFASYATNLVPGPGGNLCHAFVKDRRTGAVIWVDRKPDGGEPDRDCFGGRLTPDGRFAVFNTSATNLIPNGGDGQYSQVYRRDLVTNETVMVSVTPNGKPASGGSSGSADISADGRFVVFASNATNLVTGDTNGLPDVFLRDMVLGTTTRVSLKSNGAQSDGISKDCRISPDGRYVVFASSGALVPNDTDKTYDIYRYDRQTNTLQIVSVSAGGAVGNEDSSLPDLSADGQIVSFQSQASNLVPGDTNKYTDVFVRDMGAGTIVCASLGPDGTFVKGGGFQGAISEDGASVAYTSSGAMVPDDTNGIEDVFLRNLPGAVTTLISRPNGGGLGNGISRIPCVNGDGRVVVFQSMANNLVAADTNGQMDIFAWDDVPPAPYRPDMHIKNPADSGYLGDNVYTPPTDLADQTRAQAVMPGVTAVYQLQAQNDGTELDALRITGTPGGGGWTVAYFDAETGGNNITALVTGAGWVTAGLAQDGTVRFRVEVTPDGSVVPGTPFEVQVQATSVGDAAKSDTVAARTQVPIVYRPDMQIKNPADGAYTGDNLYTPPTDIAQQTREQTVGIGVAAVFPLQAQNDGNVTDSLTVTGPASSSGWTVRYYNAATGGSEITAAVTGAGWSTGPLAVGARAELRVEMTPDGTTTPGQVHDVLVTATSSSDPTKADQVRARGNRAGTYRPDGLIKGAGDADYVGNGLYTPPTDISQQSVAQTVGGGVAAVYHMRLENDGDVPDSLKLTGTGSAGGWTVAYYDQLSGGTDITALVTGSGWVTGSLPVGGSRQVRIEVTPAVGVAQGTLYDVLATITSTTDPAKSDQVRARTTKNSIYRPDMAIRNPGGAWVGNDLYTPPTDISQQTVSKSTAAGLPAVFHLRAENDGNTGDSIVVTGTGGTTGWTVTYWDAETGGNNITGLVTNTGWDTGLLAPGASRVFRVEVTPDSTVADYNVLNVLVTGTSSGDASKADTVRAATTKVSYQPDMQVKPGAGGAYVGDNVFTPPADISSQTVAQTVLAGTVATYPLKVENDGGTNDSFTVTGTAGEAGWQVRYFNAAAGGTEITAQVTGAGYSTPVLASGASVELRAEVTPNASVDGDAEKAIEVTATSAAAPGVSDTVRAVTTNQAVYQPDMAIRAAGDSAYIGENVLTPPQSLDLQTRSQAVPPGGSATYQLSLRNVGNDADSFTVTCLPTVQALGDWNITFFDALTGGTDITAQVIGGGWITPVVPRNGQLQFRAVVAPTTTPGGEVLNLPVKATSTTDASRSDTVRGRTTAGENTLTWSTSSVKGDQRLLWTGGTAIPVNPASSYTPVTNWYNLVTPAGSQVYLQGTRSPSSIAGSFKKYDPDGGSHSNATNVSVNNNLQFQPTYSSQTGALTRLSQTSTIGRTVTRATYTVSTNQTVIGTETRNGFWLLQHKFTAPNTVTLEVIQVAP